MHADLEDVKLRIPTAAAVQEPRQRGGLGLRARALPAAAGRGGRRLHPHRDRGHPAGRRGRHACVGVRSGDKGRGKDGEPLGNFEPGTDIKAQATVLAEGCWGHLTGAAIREFDLAEGREPQVWELGVKEVWKVAKPLDRLIHTIGPVAAEDLLQVRTDRRHLDLPDEGREDRRGHRLDRLRRRPRLRATRPPPRTTCCRRSRPIRSCARSSRAASASPGAPRRCPAAATGRCPSSRCPARCSSATPAAWSTRWR